MGIIFEYRVSGQQIIVQNGDYQSEGIQIIIIVFPRNLNILIMLKEQFRHLRKNGITELCESTAESEAVIVQAYNITIGKNDKVACLISDGGFCLKAFLKDKSALVPQKHEFAIIRIKQHVVADSGRKIGIIDFDIVCQYSQLIGKPVPLDISSMQNPQENRVFELDVKNIKTKHINIMDQKARPLVESNHKHHIVKTQQKEVKKEEKREMRMPPPKPLNGNVKDYETIKGLFIGLKNWHLLCRIIKLDYQEFQKKNSDKLVRILSLELMDRSQVRISGTFFYDVADKFKDYLKLNSVYKISEGTIANQSYNNSRNEKLSPFKLLFNQNSIFEQVSDVNIIAKSQDSAITLDQVLSRGIFDQQYDIIGILTEIEQPKEITKGDKVLTRINWVIADPMQHKRIHAVLWNDKIKADSSMVGKTIILSRFTLHNYNGSLTLNSKMRSAIQLANTHAYQHLQDEVMRDYKSYESVSDRRVKEQDGAPGNIYRNLKDLNAAIETMSMGESLKSDLDVFVNRLFMKKWNYEGCPHCNKAAEKGTSCHCGKYVEQTIPHFILSTEFSDSFGSFYTTSYDEQAKKIFWDEEGVIFKLMKIDEKQLKDVVQDYCFQQFKLRVYTKKDNEGKIKHVMGRLQTIAPEKCAMDNVDKIKEMMGKMML